MRSRLRNAKPGDIQRRQEYQRQYRRHGQTADDHERHRAPEHRWCDRDPGLEAFGSDPERRRILTILWLRCEYVGEMLPARESQERANTALQELFEAVIGAAAARGGVAPGGTPELAARALLLLVNGSVEEWLHRPGEARLVARTMPLVTPS